MITNFFIPELSNHDAQELWFQQDGATCHTARATIDLLKDTFGDRLISRFGPVNWPPRSWDLTPLDYFLFRAIFRNAGLCCFETWLNWIDKKLWTSISSREGGHHICSSLSILYRYRSHKINKNKYIGTGFRHFKQRLVQGYVKSLVYADKPQTLDHLEDNIRHVIADIWPQMLENVIEYWTSRLDYIRASRSSPMPEIIFKM
ncbi:putative LOC100569746 [Trichonephila clavipes]|nr:putative LOC100569746 [Trichonephila clavipes]